MRKEVSLTIIYAMYLARGIKVAFLEAAFFRMFPNSWHIVSCICIIIPYYGKNRSIAINI